MSMGLFSRIFSKVSSPYIKQDQLNASQCQQYMKQKDNKQSKFLFIKHNQTNIIAIIIILILTVVGVRLLTSSHAQSPFASVNADTGTVSGAASKQIDATARDGKSVIFGGKFYNGKILSVATSSDNISYLKQLHANGIRSEFNFNDSTGTFDDIVAHNGNTTATWLDSTTSAHIQPIPLMETYDYVTTTPNIYTETNVWSNAVVTWCKQYCYGGSFFTNNPKANEYYAPHALEILNEPYGNWYRKGAVNPTDYANMLIATRMALNNAGFSDISVLGAAGGYTSDATWIADVSAAGGYAAVQGMAVHPYSNGDIVLPVQQPYLQNGWNMIYYLHQTYNIDIYITEVGWCVNLQCSGSGGDHTQAQQSSDITDAINQLGSVTWIKDFDYYDLNNAGFELIDSSGNPLPGFTAYQTAAINNGF